MLSKNEAIILGSTRDELKEADDPLRVTDVKVCRRGDIKHRTFYDHYSSGVSQVITMNSDVIDTKIGEIATMYMGKSDGVRGFLDQLFVCIL